MREDEAATPHVERDAGRLAALIEADRTRHGALLDQLRVHDELLLRDPPAWFAEASPEEVRAYRQDVIARVKAGERDVAAAGRAFVAARAAGRALTDHAAIATWLASSGPGVQRVVRRVFGSVGGGDQVGLIDAGITCSVDALVADERA